MQDTAYSLLNKEIEDDFLELTARHESFLEDYGALAYIEDNDGLDFVDPEMFVNKFQQNLRYYLNIQTELSHQIMLQKKYIPIIYFNAAGFYEYYNYYYNQLFQTMSDSLNEELNIIQEKIIKTIDEINRSEIH